MTTENTVAAAAKKLNWEAQGDSRGQGWVKKQYTAYLADGGRLIVRAGSTGRVWEAYRVTPCQPTIHIGQFDSVGAAKAAAVAALRAA